MVVTSCNARLVFYVAILLLVGSSAVSCGQGASPAPPVSPLSPTVTRTDPHTMRTPGSVEIGQVYAAQFRGSWASGYPYPVFFLDIPYGTARFTLVEVAYGSADPLNQAHPRLDRVVQEVIWPDGNVSQLIAENFYYDEVQSLLLTYNGALDGIPLETATLDVSSARGVGIAYLGDTGGINVFYNCVSPISIDYEESAVTTDGRPTEAAFSWECKGDAYEVETQVTWGISDPEYNIDVVTGLTAVITRR